MPRILIEKGPGKGLELLLNSGQNAVIGRDEAADFVLTDDMASRKHCLVGERKGTWLIKDLETVNGTRLNGRRLEPKKAEKLERGDSIQIGETVIAFLPSSHDAKDPLVGETLGGFRIDEQLGRGAMGVVYKAHQISLNRDVALKVLSSDVSHDERFKHMFIKEARAAAALSHSNILQVYDVGDDKGHLFIAMEIAAKGSVLEELRSTGQLGLDRSLEVLNDALAALLYAEKKELVHRDIKPDNLMITADNIVKLGDLGLAASSAELGSGQAGVFGTPHYIAPEQAQGKSIDHRADIYALGASWYRMLSGETLYPGNNARDILKRQVREPHRPITQLVPDIPPAISAILDKMLAKDPDERYESAENVMEDIALFLKNRNSSIGAIGVGQVSSSGVLEASKPKSSKAPLIVGVVILLLALGGGGFVVAGIGGSSEEDKDPDGKGDGGDTIIIPNDKDKPENEVGYTQFVAAKGRIEARDPRDRHEGYSQLKALVAQHPDTGWANQARDLIEAYEAEVKQRESVEKEREKSIQATKEAWDSLIQKLEAEQLNTLEVGVAHTAMQQLHDEFLASEDEVVVETAKAHIKLDDAKQAFLGKADALLINRLTNAESRRSAAKALPLMEGPDAYKAILSDLKRWKSETDYDPFETRLNARIAAIEKTLERAVEDRNNLWRAAALAAASTSQRSLDSVLASIRQDVLGLSFDQAREKLSNFESNDSGLNGGKDNPEWSKAFADVRKQIEGRRWQTDLEERGLTWLASKWNTRRDYRVIAPGSVLSGISQFEGVEKIILRIASDSAEPFSFNLGRYSSNSSHKNHDPGTGVDLSVRSIDRRMFVGLLYWWVVELSAEDSNYNELRNAGENRLDTSECLMGVAAFLLEHDVQQLDDVLDLPRALTTSPWHYYFDSKSSIDDGVGQELRNRMRELHAHAMLREATLHLNFAEKLKAAGNLEGAEAKHQLAEAIFRQIKNEFSGTSVAEALK